MDNKIFLKKHFGILSAMALIIVKIILDFIGINFSLIFSNVFIGVFGILNLLIFQDSHYTYAKFSILTFGTMIFINLTLLAIIGLIFKLLFKKHNSNNLELKIYLWIVLWFVQIFVASLYFALFLLAEHFYSDIILIFNNSNYLYEILYILIPSFVAILIGWSYDKKTKTKRLQENISKNVLSE